MTSNRVVNMRRFKNNIPREGTKPTLGIDGLGPDGEAHLGELAGVAHAAVDHEAADAVGLAGLAEQVAEETVGVVGRAADDKDVAQRFGIAQTAGMAHVKDVKTAVGPDHTLTRRRPFGAQMLQFG